jgi:hypothetical protein
MAMQIIMAEMRFNLHKMGFWF